MEISEGKLRFIKILAFVAFIELVLVAVFGYMVIGDFEEMYKDFVEPVPFLTVLYFSTYKYWAILTLFPLFVLFQTTISNEKLKFTFLVTSSVIIAHIIFGIMIYLLAVVAIYTPIKELSNTI